MSDSTVVSVGAAPWPEGGSGWVLMLELSGKLKEGLQVPKSSLEKGSSSICCMELR